MATSAGTKVTTGRADSRNPTEKEEATGTVLSDSLAAESARAGGSFARGNAPVTDQPARGTTTNATDTTGARVLAAAPDAGARRAAEDQDASAELDAGRGLGKAAGRGPTSNVPDRGHQPHEGGDATGGAPNAAHAPSAYSAERLQEGKAKPKGQNITEGGFDADAPNASFGGDVGGKNDPGRLAENKFQQRATGSGKKGGSGAGGSELPSDGQFDALGEEEV
jgi:hypothetical protein